MTIETPDKHFDSVLVSAVRYCIGRRTYMPDVVTRWIMGHCKGQLEETTLCVMLRDIVMAADLGDDCDKATWKKFEDWLRGEGA